MGFLIVLFFILGVVALNIVITNKEPVCKYYCKESSALCSNGVYTVKIKTKVYGVI